MIGGRAGGGTDRGGAGGVGGGCSVVLKLPKCMLFANVVPFVIETTLSFGVVRVAPFGTTSRTL